MNKIILFLLFITAQFSSAQEVAEATCINPEFNKEVQKYLDFSVPVVTPTEIKDEVSKYTILDIREKEEYNLSHLPEAIHFGYDKPNWKALKKIDKETPILVYCSIGYRSEKIGEKLMKKGYLNVVNLYGSIFEWVNNGYPVCDKNSKPTNKIHGYNKEWSQWVKNSDYEVEY